MSKTLPFAILFSSILTIAHAFVVLNPVVSNANVPVVVKVVRIVPSSSDVRSTCLYMCPGGWGIGTPIDMQDEEFSNKSSARRRRTRRKRDGTGGVDEPASSSLDEVAYSAEAAERMANRYALEDSVKFSQRVKQERDNLQMQKKKDLMEIARIAGLGDRLKPKVNQDRGGVYGKFEDDGEGGSVNDGDDGDLDVRVY